MPDKFKAGDKVRCIDDTYNSRVCIGQTYTVTHYKQKSAIGDEESVKLKGINDWVYAHRFVLDQTHNLTLPTDSNERKEYPLFRGCLRYFPAALAGVAKTSKLGNDKHNPGQEMHHAREKSTDHGDCIMRHLADTEDLLAALDRGEAQITKDQVLAEVNQMAWRALAFSQLVHERFGAPLAPGAVIKSTAETGKGN